MSYRDTWRPKRNHEFVNWAQNQRSRPKFFHQPRSEEEVVSLVREVRDRGETLRCVGAGHSWSDAVCTRGNLVNLDRLDQILEVDFETGQVVVQAGIRLKHLVARLAELGLALNNLGSIMEQSVAGATATGTHGTGLEHGNLSTRITAMQLVTGTGEVLDLDEDDPRLDAARVSLGALGVVTRVTLQCEPLYNLEEKSWAIPFELGLEAIPRMIEEYGRVKFWWMPHTDQLYVFVYRRTTDPHTPSSALAQALDEFINARVFPMVLGLGTVMPSTVPFLNQVVAGSYFRDEVKRGPYEALLTLSMPPKHLEIEYGLPIDRTLEAIRRTREIVRRNDYRIGFPQEMRFVEADSIWLSPAYGRDSFQFGVYSPFGRDAKRYFRDFAGLATRMGGRPHWGKDFRLGRDELSELYPRFEDFDRLRRELDPDGIFVNDYIARIFGR